jgi:glycogen debranching enzyme
LTVSRSIDGGVHEDIDVTNHGSTAVEFNLDLLIHSDFADLFEAKSGEVVERGQITSRWSVEQRSLRTVYRNQDFCREIAVRIEASDSPPAYANGQITFALSLEHGESWHACLFYELGNGKVRIEAPSQCFAESAGSTPGRRLKKWQQEALKLETPNELLGRLFNQAVEDIASLRLPIEDNDRLQFLTAAGVPWFVGLFGRDSLIASIQNAPIHVGFARGVLDALGAYQATERDDYRDAEPGKILHELRLGELAHFGAIPHRPYYGTADATPLYLIVLYEAWRWTGDRGLLERHYRTAQKCLEWIDRHGDRDGDGFQEYATRSPEGYENQGWKDAGDAVMNSDGSPVKDPKALCELQGYVYDAWQRMAKISDELGQGDAAAQLREKAKTLFDRFNEKFWDEEQGFYAYALDGNKRKVLTVASNPGHCLWSGIVPPDRAAKVTRRLLAPDMSSGWGIRTLSADHPCFNPLSYQNGSVWPHDNGLIAFGLRRYGFAAEAAGIARDVFSAAGYFAHYQVPELYAGLQREAMSFPVQYFDANVPQAWAAGSIFMFLRTMLGLEPHAAEGKLYVDPLLPDWLQEITIRNLSVGQRKLDVRFWREGLKSCFEVLRGEPQAVSRRSFASGPELLA